MPTASGVSRSHWTPRAFREGADRSGPEARRPPSDHKAGKPSWKGWLISMHKLIAGLAAGLALLVAAPAVLAAPVTVDLRIEGASRTLFEGPVTTDVRPFQFTGDPAQHQCDATGSGGTSGTPVPTRGAA